MYIYIYTHIHVCIFIYVYVYVYIHIYMDEDRAPPVPTSSICLTISPYFQFTVCSSIQCKIQDCKQYNTLTIKS